MTEGTQEDVADREGAMAVCLFAAAVKVSMLVFLCLHPRESCAGLQLDVVMQRCERLPLSILLAGIAAASPNYG
jgi:hypothetical protein